MPNRSSATIPARVRYGQGGYFKCPACGYWAFNGAECFDCGYRR